LHHAQAVQTPELGDREPVKLFHRPVTAKPFRRDDEAIFMVPRRRRETNGCYQHPRIKQWGSIMWDIIINLIYHQSCRKYRAAARKQSALDHLWA
jgi:hypothetical protein